MRFCLIVEERYQLKRMPTAVGEHLAALGHDVTVLRPQATIACLSSLPGSEAATYDAFILKTVSDGPGRSLMEAAAATGVTTINDAAAIRLVRDKAVAAALARQRGVPFPITYFVSRSALLAQVPHDLYPLVVKPCAGSEGRGVRILEHPSLAGEVLAEDDQQGFLLAQPYLPNSGYDIKLYNTGRRIFAVRRLSPLDGGGKDADELVPVTPELRRIAEAVGKVFGLDIYGVDVLLTADGWVAVDVNDFPSFSQVPEAVGWVAETIVDVTRRRSKRGVRRASLGVAVNGVPVARAVRAPVTMAPPGDGVA
jgi:ribosomal protein S6--L-glutamate ligase